MELRQILREIAGADSYTDKIRQVCADALAEIKRLEDRQHVPSIVLELERRVEVLEKDSHPPLGQDEMYERIEALERWRDRRFGSL